MMEKYSLRSLAQLLLILSSIYTFMLICLLYPTYQWIDLINIGTGIFVIIQCIRQIRK